MTLLFLDYRYRIVDVVDTIEQLLMVHMSNATVNVGGDRRQCCTCRVFRPKAMLSTVEIGSRSLSSDFAVGNGRLTRRLFLSILLSLSGLGIEMIIALCHISGICPVEIDRLKMLV